MIISGRPAPTIERYRRFFVSPDTDFGRIKTSNYWLKGIYEALNLLKFPAPAIEYITQLGWPFHLIFL